MDKLAKQIQSNSSNHKDLKGLLEFLQKSEQFIGKNSNQIDSVLENLDTKAHTLGYAFVLCVKVQYEIDDATLFIQQCQKLFLNFNKEQASFVEARFYHIANVFTIYLTKLNLPMSGILPLKNALSNARQDENMLTPIHSDFLQLCILSRCYNAALPIVKSTILSISRGNFHHSHFLKFYYYGGIVLLAVKQYDSALLFFDRVINARAVVISAIMFEAYKKYILTSLLVDGKVSGGKSSMVQRHLKALTQPYHEFANSYATKSIQDISKCLEKHGEIFLKDRNLGLVKKCISSLYNNNIKSYTKTYLTLSLKGISEGTKIEKIEEVETRLVRMIETGDLHATLNEKDGIVSFSEASEKYDTSVTLNQLDNNIKTLIRLGDIIKYQDDKNALNFNYIQRTQLQEQRWDEQDDIGGMGGMGGMFRG